MFTPYNYLDSRPAAAELFFCHDGTGNGEYILAHFASRAAPTVCLPGTLALPFGTYTLPIPLSQHLWLGCSSRIAPSSLPGTAGPDKKADQMLGMCCHVLRNAGSRHIVAEGCFHHPGAGAANCLCPLPWSPH